ncbi:hypothetical protein SPBR_02766 [Sporothrix brasiliensis 5110]|uniref:Uncharacterized protein n=1 Tax=Sporothrix brasiliensis 5110 TaxID=1398154 RepID=A0A0C2J4S1_9PEZI|nr:uncharacterized protein SPBR_02766 [Sporothrix brasiliensis 5110]KIH92067.1 hypothetical protein SPBR_02766 [Sporothrix brasiliensis 5110]
MPSKRDHSRRGRSRRRSRSRSRSDTRTRGERFIDNLNAFMKSYSHEYTNGYYTGPKAYHPDYPNEPKVLSRDAPLRRKPKAIAYYNDNDDDGPQRSKDKGKGRARSPSRSDPRPRSSHGGGSYYGTGYGTGSGYGGSGGHVPPFVPGPPLSSGYVPTSVLDFQSNHLREYPPTPQNSGYEARGQSHHSIDGAAVFTAVHPDDVPGPSRGRSLGRDYTRGRYANDWLRSPSARPAFDYDRDASRNRSRGRSHRRSRLRSRHRSHHRSRHRSKRSQRPSSIYSNAPFESFGRSASCVPSYISGRSHSQPPSRSHSRGHASYGSVSYGGANVVTAVHPDDNYRSTSPSDGLAPSSSSRHDRPRRPRHRSHSTRHRHRRRQSLSGHSPVRYRSSSRCRRASPARERPPAYITVTEERYRKPRRRHSSRHYSRRSRDDESPGRHGSRYRSRHRRHRHHSPRPRSSGRYVEERYYSYSASRKSKKGSGGFRGLVKKLFK